VDPDGLPHEFWNGHAALLYDSEHQRRAVVTAFVRRGLQGREKVLVTVAPQEPDFLGQPDGEADLIDAQERGQLTVLPARQFYPDNGQDRLISDALSEGYVAVRLTGTSTAALSVLSPLEYLSVERAMDARCRTEPVRALCQYPRSPLPALPLRDAVAAHSDGVRSATFATAFWPGGARLQGQADVTNRDLLDVALAGAVDGLDAVPEPPPPEVVVDVSALEFLDAASCRRLLDAAASLHDRGSHLVVHTTSRHVARLLRLSLHENDEALTIVDAQR
jgi:hypothetical protein